MFLMPVVADHHRGDANTCVVDGLPGQAPQRGHRGGGGDGSFATARSPEQTRTGLNRPLCDGSIRKVLMPSAYLHRYGYLVG